MTALYYQVYGLTLSSDIPFPELGQVSLPDSSDRSDVHVQFETSSLDTVHLDWFMSWTLPNGDVWLACAKEKNGYRLRFSDAIDFFVDSGGQQIVCTAEPDQAIDTLRHLLLDQVLPLVLNLRGREALHAAAVVTPSGVCMFAGPGGTGKSTLTASFLTAGYPVLSDDCVVLEELSGQVLATPAYPGVRLWQDSLDIFQQDDSFSCPVAAYTEKQRLVPKQQARTFVTGLQPISRIYALHRSTTGEDGNDVSAPLIEILSWRESLMALVTCAFRLDITDRAMVTRQLEFLERVAASVPVRRLLIPNTLTSLPAVRAAILADVGVL